MYWLEGFGLCSRPLLDFLQLWTREVSIILLECNCCFWSFQVVCIDTTITISGKSRSGANLGSEPPSCPLPQTAFQVSLTSLLGWLLWELFSHSLWETGGWRGVMVVQTGRWCVMAGICSHIRCCLGLPSIYFPIYKLIILDSFGRTSLNEWRANGEYYPARIGMHC